MESLSDTSDFDGPSKQLQGYANRHFTREEIDSNHSHHVVYGGRSFAVRREIVLDDDAQLVEAGARHVTFGAPDFVNGPTHWLRLARELHERFARVMFDLRGVSLELLLPLSICALPLRVGLTRRLRVLVLVPLAGGLLLLEPGDGSTAAVATVSLAVVATPAAEELSAAFAAFDVDQLDSLDGVTTSTPGHSSARGARATLRNRSVVAWVAFAALGPPEQARRLGAAICGPSPPSAPARDHAEPLTSLPDGIRSRTIG